MKKIKIFIIIMLTAFYAGAQNYLINFLGTGSATTVDSIRIENLTRETALTIGGSDILNLKGADGIGDQDGSRNKIICYPNPMVDEACIDFYAQHPGTVSATLIDECGRILADCGFAANKGEECLYITGLRKGYYLLHIIGDDYAYDMKVVSAGSAVVNPNIRHSSEGNKLLNGDRLKQSEASLGSTIVMQYEHGDVLKLTGISGSYQTVQILIPQQSQSVSFPFLPCVDGSGNNYPIVKIGTQTWMASNLRTTSLNTTVSIQNISEPTAWANTTLPAYALYQNNNQYLTTYGLLYNGYAAMSGSLCPCNWHVPTDAEWTTMEIYLENHGYNYDGFIDTDNDRFTNNKIAKSLAANILWDYSPNDGAIGNDLTKNNRSGFTAQAGGYRFETGNFDYLHLYGFWWTSTSYSGSIIYRALYFTESDAKRNMLNNRYGFSVRCIKD